MTSTIEQPRRAPDEDVVQRRHQNRTLKIAVLVIVVVAVAIGGGVLIYNGVTDDDTAADVPEGVLQVVDDFIAAWTKVMTLDRFDLVEAQSGEALASR